MNFFLSLLCAQRKEWNTMKTKILNFIRSVFFKNKMVEPILIKIVAGKDFDSWTTKILPNNYQYEKGTRRRVERNGIRYDLDISNLMEWVIYYPLRESSKVELFSSVKSGDVVFDVGTHIGEHLLNFAQRAGAAGAVHGFEPDAEIYQQCRENIRLNSFENIHLNNFGLSDKKETAAIYCVNENNLGMNRIVSDAEMERVNKNSETLIKRGTIEITTLDEYAEQKNISKIDLMKIDVEGFEHKVILGGLETLRKFKPVIFIEVSNENLLENGTSADRLLGEIENLGYELKDAETMEKITLPLDPKYISPMKNNNVFCYPKP